MGGTWTAGRNQESKVVMVVGKGSAVELGQSNSLDQRDIVTLEQDLTQRPPLLLLGLCSLTHLDRVINHKVHELIEAPNLALNAES